MVGPKRSCSNASSYDKVKPKRKYNTRGNVDDSSNGLSTKGPDSYKKSHNIGNRRATNLLNSYRESDVAILCDKSYFSNFRYSMTFGRGSSKEPLRGTGESCVDVAEFASSSADGSPHNQDKEAAAGIETNKPRGHRKPQALKRSLDLGNVKGEPSESTPNKRARRTASLNAGAILTAMLEKPNSSAKKTKRKGGERPDLMIVTNHLPSTSKPFPKSPDASPKTPKSKQAESPKNVPMNKSFDKTSCSPININDESRQSSKGTSTNSNRCKGPQEKAKTPSKKPKRDQFEASRDVFCIDLTGCSEATSESQVSREEGVDRPLLKSETKSQTPHKSNRSPTLSSSSSATILSPEASVACARDGPTMNVKSSNNIREEYLRGSRKRPKASKDQASKKESVAGSSGAYIKTSRRLASLNATAVLAACLDTPRRHNKVKNPEKVTQPVHCAPSGGTSFPGNSSSSVARNNRSPTPSKKQNAKRQQGSMAPLADRKSATSALDRHDRDAVLPAKVPPKHSSNQGPSSVADSANVSTRPSKHLDKKQATRVAPWKNVVGNGGSSDSRLLASVSPSDLSLGCLQSQRNFSAGRPTSSAMVATILPHVPSQICFARPSASAFSGYPTSGVPAPVTSLLLPRQPFQGQAQDTNLLRFPYMPDGKLAYQNLGMLQCAGNAATGRQSMPSNFPTQQPMGSHSVGPYLSPPTATVLFGAPQQHINLQLCPPMAYGQVCRPFSPTAPSFFQTVPFSSERFQLCHASSSPPLGFPGSSSHIFIPYSGTSRSTNAINLNSPSRTPCLESHGQVAPQPQGRKRSSKGRTPGGSDPTYPAVGSLQVSAPLVNLAGKPLQQQYVKISPKKTEHSPATSSSTSRSASSASTQQSSAIHAPTSVVSSGSSEIRRILKFTDETVPVGVSASPNLVDLSRHAHPVFSALPECSTLAIRKDKPRKRVRTGDQKNESIQRAPDSKPAASVQLPKQETLKQVVPSSKAKKVSQASAPSPKPEDGANTEAAGDIERAAGGSGDVHYSKDSPSINHSSALTPPARVANQLRAAISQDSKIDRSVVCMGVPVKSHPTITVGAKTVEERSGSSLGKSKLPVRSPPMSKNKSPNKKRGGLLSVGFLKSLSPSRGFMKGSRKRIDGRGRRASSRLSSEKKPRRNGLNQRKGSDIPTRKLNLSACRAKSGPEKASSWSWLGEPKSKPVSFQADGTVIRRNCYPAMQHAMGDVFKVRDCVFVRSGTRKRDIPYIAKIYALWEEGEAKEMTMGVFWYYRREHVDSETMASRYLDDEVFASRHRDSVPVACIEDKCFVLPFDQYCRYRAEVSRLECSAGRSLVSRIVPPLPGAGSFSSGTLVASPPSDSNTHSSIKTSERATSESRDGVLDEKVNLDRDLPSCGVDRTLMAMKVEEPAVQKESDAVGADEPKRSPAPSDPVHTEGFNIVRELRRLINEAADLAVATVEATKVETVPVGDDLSSRFNEITTALVMDFQDIAPTEALSAQTLVVDKVEAVVLPACTLSSTCDVAASSADAVISASASSTIEATLTISLEIQSPTAATERMEEGTVPDRDVVEGQCTPIAMDVDEPREADLERTNSIIGNRDSMDRATRLETIPDDKNDVSTSSREAGIATAPEEEPLVMNGQRPCTNPAAETSAPVDVGSLKTLCSEVLNLPPVTSSSDPGSQRCFTLHPRPAAPALDLITVFSTPIVASSIVSASSDGSNEPRGSQMASDPSQVLRLSMLASLAVCSTPSALSASASLASSSSMIPPPQPASGSLPDEKEEDREAPPLATHASASAATPLSGRPFPSSGSVTEYLAREVDRDNVFLCRHIYDIKLRRISKNPNIGLHGAGSQSAQSAHGSPSNGGSQSSR